MKEDLVSLMMATAAELKEGDEVDFSGDLTPETPLVGEAAIMDSMALVAFVVAVEQAIEEQLGVAVSLADERALSQQRSPYRTIDTLAGYAVSLLKEAGADG